MYSTAERRVICPKRGPWLPVCPCPQPELDRGKAADWLGFNHEVAGNTQTINSTKASLDTPGFIPLKYAHVGAGAERAPVELC